MALWKFEKRVTHVATFSQLAKLKPKHQDAVLLPWRSVLHQFLHHPVTRSDQTDDVNSHMNKHQRDTA